MLRANIEDLHKDIEKLLRLVSELTVNRRHGVFKLLG